MARVAFERVLVYGIPAAMIVFGTIQIEDKPSAWTLLGVRPPVPKWPLAFWTIAFTVPFWLIFAQPTLGEGATLTLARGVRIYIEVQGEGPPSLVLHGGLGFDHAFFQPWLDTLRNDVQLVYVDLRRNGRSSLVRDSDFTLENMVADLEEVRKAIGCENWAVLGHSYGGPVAQLYAIEQPNAVSSLVLVDTRPSPFKLPGLQATALSEASATVADGIRRMSAVASGAAPEHGDLGWKSIWHAVLPLYVYKIPINVFQIT